MVDVIGLTKAGFSEDGILAKVKSAGKSYDLTTEQMIYLKSQGVSENIISALLQAIPATIPSPPVNTPSLTPSAAPSGPRSTPAPAPTSSAGPPEAGTGSEYVATLDANQIFLGYSKTKRLSADIKEEADTFNRELQTLKQQGKTKQELDEYRKTHGKILSDDQSQMRDSVIQDIQKAVGQYAHAQGFAVVYDKSGNFTPFFWSQQFGGGTITKPPKPSSPNGPDITDKIIETLNTGN